MPAHDDWIQVGCAPNQRRLLAFSMGALANVTRVDVLLPLPRGVHWGVAGAASTLICDGKKAFEQPNLSTFAIDATLGYAGGWMLSYASEVIPIVGRLVGS